MNMNEERRTFIGIMGSQNEAKGPTKPYKRDQKTHLFLTPKYLGQEGRSKKFSSAGHFEDFFDPSGHIFTQSVSRFYKNYEETVFNTYFAGQTLGPCPRAH